MRASQGHALRQGTTITMPWENQTLNTLILNLNHGISDVYQQVLNLQDGTISEEDIITDGYIAKGTGLNAPIVYDHDAYTYFKNLVGVYEKRFNYSYDAEIEAGSSEEEAENMAKTNAGTILPVISFTRVNQWVMNMNCSPALPTATG